MVKTTVTILTLITLTTLVTAQQNLVPNPSFEEYNICPDFASQIARATGWYSIRMTPDYLNTCAPYGWASIPSNYFGNAMSASGNAYAGIGSYWFGSNAFPECVGTPLTSPLQAGVKYFVSFKVFLGQYANPSQWCGINKLGVLFSTAPYDSTNMAPLCNCAQVYSDSIITDTLNWTKITGSFIADSNYSFIGVGRFFDNASTSSIQIAGTQCNAFYFLDDICVSTDSAFTYNYTYMPGIALAASNTELCEKFCIDFSDQSTNNPTSWLWQFPGGSPSFSANQNPDNICYNNPGTYDVTLITTILSGTDTLTLSDYITVYPTPPFPTITQSGYTLTSSSAPSYQWQFNSADIPGATNQSYTVTQTGSYTVVIGDLNGCSNSATWYVQITGIEELFSDFSFSIDPNPSNGIFMIEWMNTANGGNAIQIADVSQIEIHNAMGRLIFSSEEKIHNNHFIKSINLSYLPAAVYILELRIDDHWMRKKLIVAK